MDKIKISEINVVPIKPQNGLVAFTSCVVNESLYVGDIAVYTALNGEGYRLVFPDKMLRNGKRVQCVHPINRETTGIFTKAIIEKFEKLMEEVKDRNEKEKL